jgi:hypothetical protein
MRTQVRIVLASATLVGLLTLANGPTVARATNQTDAPSQMHHEAIETMIANAKTSQDHQTIAQYYTNEANLLEERAAKHDRMAQIYGASASGKRSTASIVRHCRNIAKSLRTAAKDNRELAQVHQRMALGSN